MLTRSTPSMRKGSILPLVAISMVALLGFVALAIDVGLLMVSRTQCQHAADCAAMAGEGMLNGDVANNNNYAAAGPKIIEAATTCQVLAKPVQAGKVNYEIGYYTYSRVTNKFGAILPSSGGAMPSGENWSLAKATVSNTASTSFAKVFGVLSLTASATATAVHRPRDVCIILDLSGSMSFDSLLGGTFYGTRTQSLNPDSIYPQFSHYSSYNPSSGTPIAIFDGEVLGMSNTAVD